MTEALPGVRVAVAPGNGGRMTHDYHLEVTGDGQDSQATRGKGSVRDGQGGR